MPARKSVVLLHVALMLWAGCASAEMGQRLFPAFPTPKRLHVLDMNGVEPWLRVPLATLQGVVNRRGPRIYLIWDWMSGATDRAWLEQTIEAKGVACQDIDDPMDLFGLYRDELSGYVIFDPTVPHTINVATTMAGVLDAVVIPPSLEAEMNSLGLAGLSDLRGRWVAGNKVKLYRWALDKYWKDCNADLLGYLDPFISQLRDYLVAARAFAFHLDPSVPEEEALLEEILSREEVEINTPIMGYFENVGGILIAAAHGCYPVAADYAGSLTVHSAMEADLPLAQGRGEPLRREGKVYVTFVLLGGEILQYALNYMREPNWNDEARGDVPLGWTYNPLMAELAPAVLEWYYDTASESDYFISPTPGLGETYPRLYENLTALTAESAGYFSLLDLREAWTHDLAEHWGSAGKIVSGLNLEALFESVSGTRYPLRIRGRQYIPARLDFSLCDSSRSEEENAQHIVDSILDQNWDTRTRFICVPLSGWCASPSLVKRVASMLGEGFEVLRPDDFVSVVTGPKLRLMCFDGMGESLRGCNVSVTDAEGFSSTGTTDGRGAVEFYVADGDCIVEAYWKGSNVAGESLRVEGYAERTLSCQVYDLDIRFTDILGLALAKASIEARTLSGEQVGKGRTDGAGSIVFPQLPEGTYEIIVSYLGQSSRHHVLASTTVQTQVTVASFTAVVGLALIGLVLVVLAYFFLHRRAKRRPKPGIPKPPPDLDAQLAATMRRIEDRRRELGG